MTKPKAPWVIGINRALLCDQATRRTGHKERRETMITTLKRLTTLIITGIFLGVTALYLYTLPALRRLPKAKERSLNGITTLDDAVRYLRSTGKSGWALVTAAQKLVNAKMAYSRRNGWDTP